VPASIRAESIHKNRKAEKGQKTIDTHRNRTTVKPTDLGFARHKQAVTIEGF
jgi:hypothetical protein